MLIATQYKKNKMKVKINDNIKQAKKRFLILDTALGLMKLSINNQFFFPIVLMHVFFCSMIVIIETLYERQIPNVMLYSD